MRKIISLFAKNYDTDRLVRDEVVSGAEWVVAGEGMATRKLDGTCCLVRDGRLYKRYELKRGKEAPPGFEAAQEPDEKTGAQPGWLPIGDGPEDQYHREAWAYHEGLLRGIPGGDPEAPVLRDGTYELCGPKVGGGGHDGANPEGFDRHMLFAHGCMLLPEAPTTFNALRDFLAAHDIEGIVWWHEDGRLVKLKKRDFGLRRPNSAAVAP